MAQLILDIPDTLLAEAFAAAGDNSLQATLLDCITIGIEHRIGVPRSKFELERLVERLMIQIRDMESGTEFTLLDLVASHKVHPNNMAFLSKAVKERSEYAINKFDVAGVREGNVIVYIRS